MMFTFFKTVIQSYNQNYERVTIEECVQGCRSCLGIFLLPVHLEPRAARAAI